MPSTNQMVFKMGSNFSIPATHQVLPQEQIAKKTREYGTGIWVLAYLFVVLNLTDMPPPRVIASAVILPETEATPPSKRRQSSISDTISKRPKLSHDASDRSPTSVRPSSPRSDEVKQDPSDQRRGSIQDRRKSSMQEEKKRSQRLFGGLLTTLSQSTPNGQQKRRQEVEKRQQEKAKQQKAADEKRRRETLTTLKTVREAEQIKFNQEAVCLPLFVDVRGWL